MNIYMAPMEGISGYVYRNAHHKYYGGVDKYFSPFIVARAAGGWTSREKNDVHPSHNQGIKLVPQIMANEAEAFVQVAKKLYDQGYKEVNFNLGCPSGTVVAKNKGCGFLRDREGLDRFFDRVFQVKDHSDAKALKISIKARLGFESTQEIEPLINIYNKYPFSEVILHARFRNDYYKGPLNMEGFEKALKTVAAPVFYNGDIYSMGDCENLYKCFPKLPGVMIGRGIIADPALPEKICGNTNDSKSETFVQRKEKQRLKEFHDELMAGYGEIMSGDRNVLYKMKELWSYMTPMFADSEKSGKKIKKASSMGAYKAAVDEMFEKELLSALIGGESRFYHGDRFKI